MVLCKKQLQYLNDLQLIFTSHTYKMLGFCSKLSISSGSLNCLLIPELKNRESSWILFSYGGGQEYKRVCKSGGNSQWLLFYAWKWHINSSFISMDQNIGSMPKPSNHWTLSSPSSAPSSLGNFKESPNFKNLSAASSAKEFDWSL